MLRRDVLMSGATLAAGFSFVAARGAPPARAAFPSVTREVVTPVAAGDGTPLHVRDWGEGAPMVFVHAWALDAGMWDYQTAFFGSHGYRCVSYDRRGHGRSGIPSGGYDADTLAADLASVIEARNLTGVTLVGHSMGGGEVVRYLARHGSSRIARVVLLAPVLPFFLKTADNPEGIDLAMIEAVRGMWRKDFPGWIVANQRPFVVAETSDGMIQWLTQMMLGCPLHVALECNRTVAETDYRPDLAKIDVPTLLIHGDTDASAPLPITGAHAAAMIPGCDFRVYEGAPHGLFVTHAERVNADILGFMET